MKYTQDSILQRLMYGDSVETIADEMAAALNAAQEEKTKLDAERAEADQKKADKRDGARWIVSAIADYYTAFGGMNEDFIAELTSLSDEKLDNIVEALDSMPEFIDRFKDISVKMKQFKDGKWNSFGLRF